MNWIMDSMKLAREHNRQLTRLRKAMSPSNRLLLAFLWGAFQGALVITLWSTSTWSALALYASVISLAFMLCFWRGTS